MEYKLHNNNRVAVLVPGFTTGTNREVLPLTEKIEAILKEHSPEFVLINLQGLTFIDSKFLGALVKGLKMAMNADADLVLTDLQKPVQSMFELTRLYNIFTIYPSEAEALKILSE